MGVKSVQVVISTMEQTVGARAGELESDRRGQYRGVRRVDPWEEVSVS